MGIKNDFCLKSVSGDYILRVHSNTPFSHGTGHGIGSYLSVHEGPINIRMSEGSFDATPLKENVFISDEPGYYEAGSFGIRLESIIRVVEDKVTQYGKNVIFILISSVNTKKAHNL